MIYFLKYLKKSKLHPINSPFHSETGLIMATLPDLCLIQAIQENFVKKNKKKLCVLSALEYARTSESSSPNNLILCV